MKKVKHEKSLWVILALTAFIYLFIPPYLMAYFFMLFNLTPFNIASLPHFNPFKVERGIPLSQTFVYLLVIWLIINIVISVFAAFVYYIFFQSNENE